MEFFLILLQLPSWRRFTRSFSWLVNIDNQKTRIGDVLPDLLPATFAYKMNYIREQIRSRLKEFIVPLYLGENFTLKVFPAENLKNVEEVISWGCKQFEELKKVMLKFIDGRLLDTEFIRAYKDEDKVRNDRIEWRRSIAFFAQWLHDNVPQYAEFTTEELQQYLIRDIRKRVERLLDGFRVIILKASPEAASFIAQGVGIDDAELIRLTEETKQEIKKQMANHLKRLIEKAKEAYVKNKAVFIKRITDLIETYDLKSELSLEDLQKINLVKLYFQLKDLVKQVKASEEIPEHVKKEAEETITFLTDSVKVNIRSLAGELEKMGKVAQSRELQNFAKRVAELDENTLGQMRDAEIAAMLDNLL